MIFIDRLMQVFSALWLRTVAREGREQQEGLDPSGLSNLLQNQQQEAQSNAPGAMGMLTSMLDQNKDGSAMDDLQRMASGFFK